jgi:hypothetical protein
MAVEPISGIGNAIGGIFNFLGVVLQPPRQEVAIYTLEKREGQTTLIAFIIFLFISISIIFYFALKKI